MKSTKRLKHLTTATLITLSTLLIIGCSTSQPTKLLYILCPDSYSYDPTLKICKKPYTTKDSPQYYSINSLTDEATLRSSSLKKTAKKPAIKQSPKKLSCEEVFTLINKCSGR